MIEFSSFQFHPVIALPPGYEIFDFTRGYDPARSLLNGYGVGRYNEDRRGMYNAALFQNESGAAPRTIHMGIDIGAPAGTEVRAFYEGEIFLVGYNGAEGDYGHTVITQHELNGQKLYVLHGHLSEASTRGKKVGEKFSAGQVIGWLGDRHENGGWNPHLHFQLSLLKPETCDMPGVVSAENRLEALRVYPDPRLVLGALY